MTGFYNAQAVLTDLVHPVNPVAFGLDFQPSSLGAKKKDFLGVLELPWCLRVKNALGAKRVWF